VIAPPSSRTPQPSPESIAREEDDIDRYDCSEIGKTWEHLLNTLPNDRLADKHLEPMLLE
jgi:hypothetical protein